ncbi:MAG: BMC domain-containing protein [Clostridiales Family XIII bacterium]|jgi:microcompartment protein CcmL/EutN|nr:BMC domain-containing protein [Clostridiales Family XIII bacterium]
MSKHALGMIEVASIPAGIEAGDAMMKAADVELVSAHPVCAGKYIVVVTGEVSAVKSSVQTGEECAGMKLVDSVVIPNVDEQVPAAIVMCNEVGEVGAIGSVELFSLCAAVTAADTIVKAANVKLIEVRLGRGLGGKAFIILTGEVAAVNAAIRVAKALDEVQGLMSEIVVIPSPHPDIVNALM